MMAIYFCFMVLFAVQGLEVYSEYIEQDTEEGKIWGRTLLTVEQQKTYYAFQGIPFAEPPNRFKLPVKKAPWAGTMNCTYDKPVCVQGLTPVFGSEDCLTASVYSTNLTSKNPVLVWFHGGGFFGGSGSYSEHGPDYLLNLGGLVIVLVQYRLGIFGFMSTGDLECPGNLGLHDQALALEWTKRNIHHFGGDANDITIGGISAGAASVSYHLLSPVSAGKFNKAIMNSGVAECLWSLNINAVENAYAVGASFGIIPRNSADLVSGLKGIDYKKLQEHSLGLTTVAVGFNALEGIQYGPVQEVPHDTAFFTGKADEMFLTGNFAKVPILVGFASNEMAAFATPKNSPLYLAVMANLDAQIWNLAPESLTKDNIKKLRAALDIKLKYFGILPMTPQVKQAVKFFSVDQFVRPINRFVKNVREFVNVFYYVFTHEGVLGGVTTRPVKGTQHAEDQGYLWVRNISNVPPQDIVVRNIMVKLVSDFCKTGYPTIPNVNWLTASSSDPPFLMNLNSTPNKTSNIYEKDIIFYDELFEEFGEGNYNTY